MTKQEINIEALKHTIKDTEHRLQSINTELRDNAAELNRLLEYRGIAKHDLKVLKAQLTKYYKRPDNFK